MQFYIINQQNWRKKVKCYIDPKISHQSLYGTINQNVYVWNLFIPKDRALAFENEGETKPYFRDTYSGTPCMNPLSVTGFPKLFDEKYLQDGWIL